MPKLKDLLDLRPNPFNADPRGEEFAPLAPRMDIEMGDSEWGLEQGCQRLRPVASSGLDFSVFVDGVQRTVMVGRFATPAFSQVPLHAFEVVAGSVLRYKDLRVRAGSWVRLRGVVAPFAAAFEDVSYASKVAKSLAEATGLEVGEAKDLGTDPLLPLKPKGPSLWVFDSSLLGIGGTSGKLLSPEELPNDARVRVLSLAKVAHARQVLELGVHLAIRHNELRLDPEKLLPSLRTPGTEKRPWVMHDGPLFFTARRRQIMQRTLRLSRETLDRAILGRVVGYVKSHRLRPADVDCVLKTPKGMLTEARSHRAVEPPDYYSRLETTEQDDQRYALDVYSFYMRMLDEDDLRKAGLSGSGLVRVQFGVPLLEELGVENANQAAQRLAGIVLRERVPYPRYRFQPYANAVLELYLRGKLTYPDRLQRQVAGWFLA